MRAVIYEVLSKIEKSGHEAYLIGGYPRDFYLGKKTEDYDICTSAKPTLLKTLFKDILQENFGSLKISYNGSLFEITTFRVEKGYTSVRTPNIFYTDSLEEDLSRRDFTINTLCMNKEGEYIDYLDARKDIDRKIIRAVGNPFQKMKEDPLRILRAIRFATILHFTIERELKEAIIANKEYVKNLSYQKKKEEIDKILLSENCLNGISLLKEYGLDVVLECRFPSTIVKSSSKEAMWAQIDYSSQYPFTKHEKKWISQIREIKSLKKICNFDLYEKGLEIYRLAAQLIGVTEEEILVRYTNLPIHNRKDIDISISDIETESQEKPSVVYSILEKKILNGELSNEKKEILNYLRSYFK